VNQTYKWKKYVTGNLKASFLSTTKLETKTLSECIRFSGTKETSPSLWTFKKTIFEIILNLKKNPLIKLEHHI